MATVKLSRKHHYLPEFYLRGFTNEKGKFHVYDYSKSIIKKGEYAPSTHFFEIDRNTIEFKGKRSDFPEQGYSLRDDRFSKLFKVIQKSNGIPTLSVEQMLTLQQFISNIFWRIPKNDNLYREQFKSKATFTKVIQFKDRKTGAIVNNAITEEIRNSEAFINAFRISVSDLTFMEHNKDDINHWRISYGPGDFHICPDNPLLLKDENATDVFHSDFVFPLTKNHLLIRTIKPLNMELLSPPLGVTMQMALFSQGEKYACCARRDFLQTVSMTNHAFEKVILRKMVFSELAAAQ